ncbi:hypothetical protein CLV56_0964 [Mumia flava]|uniref:Uncharacterized protein n=1 Tax=Mumia flava TaxID=1348852 RepID=A0A0B2B784_9ACTN|nr:hypothetical protein [Mumia flava]PJJ56753.1 hypothetical protein CLV56_0964 [Mumia flava]
MPSARTYATSLVAAVRDHPEERLALMRSLYEAQPGLPELHLPYRRAALAVMGWQVRRGLLNPVHAPVAGSPWWRAVNEQLLLDTAEARGHVMGLSGPPSSWSAECCTQFALRPSPRTWYRAHNASIVSAYLQHRTLAEAETRAERFFLNLILVRVLFAHALVAAPRLALSRLWPLGPRLGDPRVAVTSIFVSLSRVLPDRYPLDQDLGWYIRNEGALGRALDLGVILPRVGALYSWSADELRLPELATLVQGGIPSYAWDPADASPWDPPTNTWARAARTLLPPQR